MRIVLLSALVALASCANPPEEPFLSEVLPGQYQSVADCSYLKLLDKSAYVRQAVLASQNKIVISQANEFSVLWHVEFSPAADGDDTLVEFRPVRIIGSGGRLASEVMPVVRSCARR